MACISLQLEDSSVPPHTVSEIDRVAVMLFVFQAWDIVLFSTDV
jgi:hypothetical protein